MRWAGDKTLYALDELVRTSFIEYDMEAQLLRVPGAPHYRPCTNANILKGWFRMWKDVTESPLKYSQIESIRDALNHRSWFKEGWNDTFGQVKAPSHSRQVPLFLIAAPDESNQTEFSNLDANRKGLPIPLPKELVGSVTVTVPVTDIDTVPVTEGHERPRVADPIERGMIASELWRFQESLRCELAPNVTPRDHPTGHDLRLIVEALELYSREELENSLRVNAATAANNPEKLQYFNGFNNWHPNSLKRTVGQVLPTSSGRIAVRGRKKFKGGSVL
jgi:hypothetical protein